MAGFTKLVPEIIQSSVWNQTSDVRIVWITLIAIKDKDGYVRGDAATIARLANVPQDITSQALELFQQPDPSSHTLLNEGRRIAPAPGGWMVLNHALYRAPDRTEYMREYMKTYRANSGKQDVNANTTLPSVSVSASDMSDRGCKGGPFDAFWTAYPRKIGRKAAQKAWERAKDKPELAVILSAVEVQKQSEQWCKDGGQYIPHPATWLNQGRWDDKPLVTTGAAIKRPCNIRMQYRDRTTGTWLPEGWTIPKDCPNPDNFVIQEHKL